MSHWDGKIREDECLQIKSNLTVLMIKWNACFFVPDSHNQLEKDIYQTSGKTKHKLHIVIYNEVLAEEMIFI